METTIDKFLTEIDFFLAETGMDALTFGVLALKDPTFISAIRRGRSPTARTMDKVRAFIADYK